MMENRMNINSFYHLFFFARFEFCAHLQPEARSNLFKGTIKTVAPTSPAW